MVERIFFLLGVVGGLFLAVQPVDAAVIDYTAGRIVLQVESHGEAWYVDPLTHQRSYLGRPDDAFDLMRESGLGITNTRLTEIPEAGSSDEGNMALRERLSGRILLQVEENGEAWYVYPNDLKRYYLGKPDDAFVMMQELGLGVSNTNLVQIPAVGSLTNSYEYRSIDTSRGVFTIHIATIDLSNSLLEVITETGNETDCSNGCPAKSLAEYAAIHDGIAGIHGTYFCPPDYGTCQGEVNSYLSPVYNSRLGRFMNEERLAYTAGPLMAFDTNNTPYFFYRTEDFGTKEEFEERFNTTLQGAISNGPALILSGQNVVDHEPMDDKQQNTRGNRGGIGVKGLTLYLVIATNATVPDLAAVFESLDVDHAMNLDGGGSSALYFNGEYKVGPGRLLPNAIIVRAR